VQVQAISATKFYYQPPRLPILEDLDP